MYTIRLTSFHKLVMVFLKLSGFDPCNDLFSQSTPRRNGIKNCILKFSSWVYSLVVVGVLLSGFLTLWYQALTNGEYGGTVVLNTVFRLWSAVIFLHVLSFPLAFVSRRKRIIKMNKVFIRWLDEHLSLSSVSSTDFLFVGLFVLTQSTQPIFFLSNHSINSLFHFMLFVLTLSTLLFNTTFMLFNMFVEKIYVKTFEFCLTTIEINFTETHLTMYIKEPNFIWPENFASAREKNNSSRPLAVEILRNLFTHIEYLVSDVYGLVDEFASIFGESILIWTLASLPNYFITVYVIIYTTTTDDVFNFHNYDNFFLLLSQVFSSLQIYSFGDTIEETVSSLSLFNK